MKFSVSIELVSPVSHISLPIPPLYCPSELSPTPIFPFCFLHLYYCPDEVDSTNQHFFMRNLINFSIITYIDIVKLRKMNSTYSIGSRFCPRCFYFQRAHYGTPRFKPKILKTKPLRTPSMLALDNFDFYYAPLFGKKWPSIRLGLLMPNKFAAVINRYSQGFETNKEIIASLGTTDLIENLINGRKSPDEINEMRQKLDEQLSQLRFGQQNFQEIENREETQNEIFNLDDRLEGGIKQFLPPTHEIQLGKSRKNEEDGEDESKSNARKIIFDSKFTITGLESVDQGMEDELPTLDDIPIYPSSLQTFIYPKMCIDGFPGPIRDNKNISSWWLLDGASILPVLALDLQEDDNVLDMCASPGGKSLMIIQTNKFATLVCNDNKLQRLGQLRRSLGMYIPADSEVFSRIIIKRKDAASVEAWDDIELYDKVIADVPCTTDRLSANQDPGNVFATERTQERLNLPQMQTKMLINALRSVRVGGSVVYSTCSMAPTQNEMVIENAAVLARQNYGIECVERGLKRMEADLERAGGLFHFSDQQKRGSLILPNILSNFGPMFLCKLQRIR